MSDAEGFESIVRLCDGRHPVVYVAVLRLSAEQATLTGDGFERHYPTTSLRVSPRIASAPRFVALPDGGELECDDGVWLDSLPQQERSEGPVAWLERRSWVALAAVAMTALGLVLFYFFGLDALGDRIVTVIPIERELRFGERTLRSLDSGLLERSELTAERTQGIAALFERYSSKTPEHGRVRLEFRNSVVFGPNAFTLPGGIIIVTDQLVSLMSSDEEVMAVLAHELGHAHYRHVLRQTIKSSGTAVLAGVLGGDASSVAGGLSSAFVLLGTKFSREFETQADAYATEMLQKNQLSPALFGDALAALVKDEDRRGAHEGYSFLSDHPGTADRIARARAAASAAPK
ncbi:MAG TPA: M48 family metallopeptidase [Polyangiaceae bacterium]